MLISKRELLAITGISYGQLYRWKRERLIPEEWFIKQSSFTGQETFFPKEQMLNRIRAIQELKDRYSLEELAKILSPEATEVGYTVEDIRAVAEVNSDIFPIFHTILNKSIYSYMDLLFMIVLSDLHRELNLTVLQTGNLLEGIKSYLADLKTTEYTLDVFRIKEDYYAVIYQNASHIIFDKRFQVVKKINLNEISNKIKFKNSKINF